MCQVHKPRTDEIDDLPVFNHYIGISHQVLQSSQIHIQHQPPLLKKYKWELNNYFVFYMITIKQWRNTLCHKNVILPVLLLVPQSNDILESQNR